MTTAIKVQKERMAQIAEARKTIMAYERKNWKMRGRNKARLGNGRQALNDAYRDPTGKKWETALEVIEMVNEDGPGMVAVAFNG